MHPSYVSLSSLFEHKPSYVVPTYQRAYAWSEGQIDDFIKDISLVFKQREQGNPVEHFFGGIICVDVPYPGAPPVQQYEIIDGQQRLTTFSILANVLIHHYQYLAQEAHNEGKNELQIQSISQLDDLKKRFLEFNQIVAGEQVTIPVMKLSRRDHEFFAALIRGGKQEATIKSHEKLRVAFDKIYKETKNLLDEADNLSDRFNKLIVFENSIAADYKLLLLSTTTKKDAYRLFQVINDRGASLTDADLIRSRILELMEGNANQQDEAERLLDVIVSHEGTEEQLSWVYESYIGKKPRSDAMFDDYMEGFFTNDKDNSLTLEEVDKLLEEVRLLNSCVIQVRDFQSGIWPYETSQPVVAWDRDRLSVLVEYLGNSAAIPLLLSATELSQNDFSEVVQMLERFFYRYKVMCGGHNGPLKAIYSQHSLRIRQNPVNYDKEGLREDLNKLLDERATIDSFKLAIDELFYSKRGGNKPLKHLLLMVNQFHSWFLQRGNGVPACLDKTSIKDRKEGTTIEHIYSKGFAEDDPNYDVVLEEMKNSIKNLTILSTDENNLAGMEGFDDKKAVYGSSSFPLNRIISQKQSWGEADVNEYSDLIKNIASAVFRA